MANTHEIKSEKILVKDIFSRMWFRIPEYQRPYIWGKDEVHDLLDDLTFAQAEKADQEYFLGSIVFQAKPASAVMGQEFDENDLLDGQQRMTTLLLLFACIRDLATDPEAQRECQNCIYQQGSTFRNVPERNRLMFAIRKEVQGFIEAYVKVAGGTTHEEDLTRLAEKEDDKSIRNMARAILEIRAFFKAQPAIAVEPLLEFLLNRVLLIYVATQDLEDAFRLFTILNNRGVPLRNSDILKSMNLGELANEAEKIRCAKLWEDAEGALGEDFDRFLNYLRTILLKDKARLSLLQEFEQKIYVAKGRSKAGEEKKPALLAKGAQTFEFVERYLRHYNLLLSGDNKGYVGNDFKFDNLIHVMLTGLPSTDWLPPLLRYFDKFKYQSLYEFLKKLDNKFSSDWIAQHPPTERIERMNLVIRAIEVATSPGVLFADPCFDIDKAPFIRNIEVEVYGRRFTRYLLIKLDFLFHNPDQRMNLESLSVEHILPQNPGASSQWRKDFNDAERGKLVDLLGNLVLITAKKNSAQGNVDFALKKAKYFVSKIDTCPNSLRVLQSEKWTPVELVANHKQVLTELHMHYEIK